MNALPETSETRTEFAHANWWPVITGAAWLAFSALTLGVPMLDGGIAVAARVASVVLGMVLLLTILMAAERPKWSLSTRICMAAVGIGVVLLAYFLNLKGSELKPLIALALMALAVPVGYWIGERMEKITNLIPLAIAMSLADIFSVFQGPTKVIADNLTTHYKKVATLTNQGTPAAMQELDTMRAPLADYIIVHFPIAGMQTSLPILGIGDFVVLAFLFRAAWVHHVSPRLMLCAAAGSIFAALLVSNALSMPLPALPFIAIGTIAVLFLTQPRLRRLDRQEVVLSLVVVALFGALITGKYLNALMKMQ
ncbi:MAG: hypothetical protein M3R04_02210 [bacterium]|nr:hypothetical protein [bacterium]